MANNVIGSLLVNLGLETGRLNSDTKKAAKHFNSFDKKASRSLNNIKGRVSGLMGSMGALTGVAGTLSVVGFGAMIKSSIDAADNIGKMSDRLGASTEALSQYSHVAQLSGVRVETLTMGWQRMTRRVAEAAAGTGEARNALIELNLSAQDLNKLKPEEQFEVLADALNGVVNPADKVRLAMKLFDSEGVSLLQTMTRGAEGIREMRREADDLGLTLSRDQTDAAAKAADSITRLSATWKGFSQSMALEFADPLSKIIRQLSIGIPNAVKLAQPAFDDIGKDIFNFWQLLNPSEITGQTTLADALEKQVELQKKLGMLKDFGAVAGIEKIQAEIDKNNLLIDSLERKAGIEKKMQEVAELNRVSNEKNGLKIDVSGGVGGASTDDKENERLQKRLDSLNLSLLTEEERLFDSYANRQLIAEDAFENELINEQRHQEILLGLAADHETKLTALKAKEAQNQIKLENDVQSRIVSMRQSVASLSVGLLRTLGQESKSFALASIALEKGLSIALATQNTAVAVTKAYSVDPTGLLASRVAILGKIQIGLIAATGLAEASNISGGTSGGSSLGGATVPVSESFGSTGSTDGAVSQGSAITINIEGSVLSTQDEIRAIVVAAIEQAEANDEIRLISNG